jgi:hypothetical protein
MSIIHMGTLFLWDSDSEAEFLGFDAVELDEIDHINVVPEFEIPNLDNDDDIITCVSVDFI